MATEQVKDRYPATEEGKERPVGTEQVKVYVETKKKGIPVWMWLVPLILLLGLLLWAFTRHHDDNTAAVAPATTPTATLPDLGTVHFNTNQATLTPEGQATLQRAAAAMKQQPNLRLRLEGYTDSTGSAAHNGDLSQARTATVAQYLMAQGIAKDRLTGGGFGEANPVANNSSADGKADNRRVALYSQQ